jgi:hypothetical protein
MFAEQLNEVVTLILFEAPVGMIRASGAPAIYQTNESSKATYFCEAWQA